MKTRIAPTPNGHLHLGNIFNFIYTASEAKRLGLKIALRIDDHDKLRCRDHFIDEVFKVLDILKIDIDEGPSGTDDFNKNFSQTLKFDHYKEKLNKLSRKFFCECSRKDVFERNPLGIYDGYCKGRNLANMKQAFCIRYDCPDEKYYLDRSDEILIKESIGDIILWRKDDIPSYQLVSIIDDIDMGISHIFRGEDLLNSSAIQLSIAKQFDTKFVEEENFFHHRLATYNGEKMSKSRKSKGILELLEKDSCKIFREYSSFMNIQVVENINELYLLS